jgi:ATP-dependent Clp protease ATP-binding subunit ClpA
MFAALSEDDLAQIVELSVDALQRRLRDRRLTLAVTPDARAWLAERGYDPIFGARPLRRLIQSEIQDRLAMALLSAACTTATSCASMSRPTARGSCSRAPGCARRAIGCRGIHRRG